MYDHEGRTQSQIAARLGVSPATIVNRLPEARERGLVRITLSPEAFTGHRLAEAMEPARTEDVPVLPLMGSLATPHGFTAEICSAHLAMKPGARLVNLHAPAVLPDPDLARRLRAEPIIAARLQALSRCNRAIFAAGSVNHESHVVRAGVASHEDAPPRPAETAAPADCPVCARMACKPDSVQASPRELRTRSPWATIRLRASLPMR